MNTRKAIATFALIALTATSAFAFEGGNPKKGKFLYKKSCRSCHLDGAEAPALTPLSKTQSQWNRFFEKGGHPGETLKGLSDQELNDIRQYLHNHAADSDQPETCG